MTASALAHLLKARRIGKGKWSARCPGHPDRRASLAITEGKRGVLIRCMSHGCDTRDILDAMGLSFSDLFFDKMTPQVFARTQIYDLRESLERELGLAMWLGALEKPAYWRVVERRIVAELLAVRCKIEPLVVYREQRSAQWQVMNRSQRERELDRVWNTLSNLQP
jgi:hypothetical protein